MLVLQLDNLNCLVDVMTLLSYLVYHQHTHDYFRLRYEVCNLDYLYQCQLNYILFLHLFQKQLVLLLNLQLVSYHLFVYQAHYQSMHRHNKQIVYQYHFRTINLLLRRLEEHLVLLFSFDNKCPVVHLINQHLTQSQRRLYHLSISRPSHTMYHQNRSCHE